MRPRSIVLIAFVALAAGQASGQSAAPPAKAPAPNQCFRQSDIESSIQAARDHLNIKVRDGRYFQIQTKNVCFVEPGFDHYVLQIRGGGDQVCQPIDLDMSAGTGGMMTPCFVDKIVPMTKAEVAALPKREQP